MDKLKEGVEDGIDPWHEGGKEVAPKRGLKFFLEYADIVALAAASHRHLLCADELRDEAGRQGLQEEEVPVPRRRPRGRQGRV